MGYFSVSGGPMGNFCDWIKVQNFFESTHIDKQLLFSILPLILTFNFDLILGPFLAFWSPNELMLGVGVRFKNIFGVYLYS